MTFLEFKDKYFKGDEKTAIAYLAHEGYTENYVLTKNKTHLKAIIDELDENQALIYWDYYKIEIEKNPQKFEKSIDNATDLAFAGLTYEEIEKEEKNPYARKILINLLVVLLGFFVIFILLYLRNILPQHSTLLNEIVKFCAPIFYATYSYKLVFDTIKFFKFRKHKKQITGMEKKNDIQITVSEDKAMKIAESFLKEFVKQPEKVVLNREKCTRLISELYKNKSELNEIENLNFYIEVLQCEKKSRLSNNESDKKLICFSNNTDYCIDFENAGKNTLLEIFRETNVILSEHKLYESINENDECYAFYISNEKNIIFAVPCKNYILSENEFINEGLKITPVKDTSYSKLSATATKEQYDSYSPEEQKSIDATERALKKAERKCKRYVIYTVIIAALTLLGIFSEGLAALNLLGLPILFILPFISAKITTRKVKKLLSKTPREYSYSATISDRILNYEWKLLLIVPNLIVWILNGVTLSFIHHLF